MKFSDCLESNVIQFPTIKRKRQVRADREKGTDPMTGLPLDPDFDKTQYIIVDDSGSAHAIAPTREKAESRRKELQLKFGKPLHIETI